MSKTSCTLFVILLCTMAICSAAAQTPHTISGVFDYDKASQVVANINEERQEKKLAPLKMDAALTEAAMLRAAEFAYRVEVEQVQKFLSYYDKRPNGDDNLTLIGEQGHATQPNVEYVFLYLEHNLYIPQAYAGADAVVSFLKEKRRRGSAALYTAAMHSIGCGAFLSPQGFYYWVFFLMPDNGTDKEIPNGQWTTEISIGTSKGEQTTSLTRVKSDTDLTPTSVKISGHFDYFKAIEVVDLTNKERVANGLKPHIMDATLTELAMIRAAEVKALGKISHVRPNGDRGDEIIDEVWGAGWWTRENLGWGYDGLPSTFVKRWMESPGHRDAILDPKCTRMGVGVCDDYWVQLFADYKGKSTVLSKSAGHIEEVTVEVTVVEGGKSKVLKRKRVN